MCVLSLGLRAFQPLCFDLLLMVRAVMFSGRCALGGVCRWIRIEMRSFKWTTFTALVLNCAGSTEFYKSGKLVSA